VRFWKPPGGATEMQAPLDEVRQKLGLRTVAELGIVLGCRYHAIYNAVRGFAPIPKAAWGPLQELGVDLSALLEDQATFVAARAAQLRAELKARLAAPGEGLR